MQWNGVQNGLFAESSDTFLDLFRRRSILQRRYLLDTILCRSPASQPASRAELSESKGELTESRENSRGDSLGFSDEDGECRVGLLRRQIARSDECSAN